MLCIPPFSRRATTLVFSSLVLSLMIGNPAKCQDSNQPPNSSGAPPRAGSTKETKPRPAVSLKLKLRTGAVASDAGKNPEAQAAKSKTPTPLEQQQLITAVTEANKAVTDAQEILDKTTDITTNTAAISPDDAGIAHLDNIATTVAGLIKSKLVDQRTLDSRTDALKTARKSLDGVKSIIDQGSAGTDAIPGFNDARTKYGALVQATDDLPKKLKDAEDALRKGLVGYLTAEKKLFGKLSETISPLYNLPGDASKTRLRETLAKQHPTFAESVRLRYAIEPKLKTLHDEGHLKSLYAGNGDYAAETLAASEALGNLNRQISVILDHEERWLLQLVSDTIDEGRAAKDVFNQDLSDPRQFGEAAHAQAKTSFAVLADLETVLTKAKAFLADGAPVTKSDFPSTWLPAGFSIPALVGHLDELRKAKEQLVVVASELNTSHPFDISQWQADQIPLYYFDDVAQLIRVLSPTAAIVGNTTAQDAARAARQKLDSDSQALANAHAKVEEVRNLLAIRREALRVAQVGNAQRTADSDAKLRAAQTKADAAAAKLRTVQLQHDRLQAVATRAEADESVAQKEFDETKADPKADPERLSRLKARLDAARINTNAANERVGLSEADVNKATADNNAAQSELTSATSSATATTNDLTTQASTLQAQFDTALAASQDAESKVRDSMTNAFLTAQAENAAFAFSRDNAPFWMSVPTSDQLKSDDQATISDPMHRVMLFGFPNSRTLFIRGVESDVQIVKRMIAQFDQPQAQAEMTVYTLEVGSETTSAGVKKTVQGTNVVSQELAIHQAQVDTCLTYLRQLINEQVRACCEDRDSVAEYEEFYDPCVLAAIGDVSTVPSRRGAAQQVTAEYLRALLPRPSGTATLAEAIIVLVLAKQSIRHCILDKFFCHVEHEIAKAVSSLPKTLTEKTAADLATTRQLFSNMKRVFGDKPDIESADVRAFQQEIIEELRDNAATSVGIRQIQLLTQHRYFVDKLQQADSNIWRIPLDLSASLGELNRMKSTVESARAARDVAQRTALAQRFAAQQKLAEAGALGEAAKKAAKDAETAASDAEKAEVQSAQVSMKVTTDPTTIDTAKTAANTAFDKASGANRAEKTATEKLQEASKTLVANALTEKQTADSELSDARKKLKNKPEDPAKIKAKVDAEKAARDAKDKLDAAVAAQKAADDAVMAREEAIRLSDSAQKALILANGDLKKGILAVAADARSSAAKIPNLLVIHNGYVVDLTNVVDQMAYPLSVALSSTSVNTDFVTEELAKRKKALCDGAAPIRKLKTTLEDQAEKLRTIAGKLPTDVPLDFDTIIRAISFPRNELDNAALSSRDGFGNLTASQLISQIRGENRADWYQKRHAARARANETLKRFILAVDEDIKGQYVNPLMVRLQLRLLDLRLQVGILQKTSILASNRLIARVDPLASASLPLGQEQNILQESLQLAQLVIAAQTGGATTALAGTKGSITSVLNALNGTPNEAPPGVYGITTGNVFQVTPIFDPTGQALRFRFDYVAANQIREPSGKTDPQVPRIERHSINTEVQLSNYQMRSVSSFVSNSQLGQPTRYSGGIPILKDIPFVNQIPLIGWFTRRGGHAAVAQESLVLAHTSMYPTLQDVIQSLVQPIDTPSVDFRIVPHPQKRADGHKRSEDTLPQLGQPVDKH